MVPTKVLVNLNSDEEVKGVVSVEIGSLNRVEDPTLLTCELTISHPVFHRFPVPVHLRNLSVGKFTDRFTCWVVYLL